MDNPIIIIDPEIQGGDPTIKGHGIRTAVVYDLWLGEKKQIKPVCEWFRITEEKAMAAIKYEEELIKEKEKQVKYQYRKKPVVIEAFQMTRERRSNNSEWPNWLNQAWQKDWSQEGSLTCVDFPHSDGTDKLLIRTLEGPLLVDWDDWIIQGVAGEIYPCEPDIFDATYEKE